MVLADRYIYTLMARDLVRGMDDAWLRNLYGIALVPDAVFYLKVSPEQLIQRTLAKKHVLDYWESGMDLGLSRDMFDSFLKYQGMFAEVFQRLQSVYEFDIIDGDRSLEDVSRALQQKIEIVLQGKLAEA
jgi:dTMP kinase